MQNTHLYNSPEDLIEKLRPEEPVLCISESKLKEAVKTFIQGFPGEVLYAVKANPHPEVIKALYRAGIHSFDVASLNEIKKIFLLEKKAHCYFNHPIKNSRAIKESYSIYGLRHFVVDSLSEWEKVMEGTGPDITIEFRLSVRSGSRYFDFSEKFGMSPEEAIHCIHETQKRKIAWALFFHVSSQSEDITAYKDALELCEKIIEEVKEKPSFIDVGGGFPCGGEGFSIEKMNEIFNLISQAREKWSFPSLLCEPGRALVADAGTLVTQVVTVNKDKLYLNDGIYGGLSEVNEIQLNPKVRAFSLSHSLHEKLKPYRVFGPTCDSIDKLNSTFSLPDNLMEGDWVMIPTLGAYSIALTTHFNGFSSETLYMVD